MQPPDSPELSPEWPRLRAALELAPGFGYYLVFTDWPEQNRAGLAYLQDALKLRSRRLQIVQPDAAQTLVRDVVGALFADGQTTGAPVWLDCSRNTQDTDWKLARRALMARLNEGRTRLETEFRRPLILLWPPDQIDAAAEAAPDLWSIRRLTLHLQRPAPENLAARQATATTPSLDADSQARAERYLGAWQRQWDAAQSGGGAHRLALGDANDAVQALLEVGRLDHARQVAEQALLGARAQFVANDPHTLRQLAIALDDLGAAIHAQGDLQAARAAYRESLDLRRQLRQALGDTPQALRDLSVSLDNVGQVSRDLGELEAARAAYRESLELSRQLRQALGDTPQALRDLSIALNNVGRVSGDLGELEAARAAYRESLELSRQLRQALGDTPGSLYDLAYSMWLWGELHAEEGHLAEARAAYTEGMDLARRLIAFQPDHPGYLKLLAALEAALETLNQTADAAQKS